MLYRGEWGKMSHMFFKRFGTQTTLGLRKVVQRMPWKPFSVTTDPWVFNPAPGGHSPAEFRSNPISTLLN